MLEKKGLEELECRIAATELNITQKQEHLYIALRKGADTIDLENTILRLRMILEGLLAQRRSLIRQFHATNRPRRRPESQPPAT